MSTCTVENTLCVTIKGKTSVLKNKELIASIVFHNDFDVIRSSFDPKRRRIFAYLSPPFKYSVIEAYKTADINIKPFPQGSISFYIKTNLKTQKLEKRIQTICEFEFLEKVSLPHSPCKVFILFLNNDTAPTMKKVIKERKIEGIDEILCIRDSREVEKTSIPIYITKQSEFQKSDDYKVVNGMQKILLSRKDITSGYLQRIKSIPSIKIGLPFYSIYGKQSQFLEKVFGLPRDCFIEDPDFSNMVLNQEPHPKPPDQLNRIRSILQTRHLVGDLFELFFEMAKDNKDSLDFENDDKLFSSICKIHSIDFEELFKESIKNSRDYQTICDELFSESY